MEPVHDRHREIEDEGVGLFGNRHPDRLRSVRRLGDDLEPAVLLEDDPQKQPELGRVVREDDTEPAVPHAVLEAETEAGVARTRSPGSSLPLSPALSSCSATIACATRSVVAIAVRACSSWPAWSAR